MEIIRDAFGTPHIFAATPAGAAFGAGFAQAEDRPEALLKNLSLSEEPTPLTSDLQAIVECLFAAHYSENEILDYLTGPLGLSDAEATAAVLAAGS